MSRPVHTKDSEQRGPCEKVLLVRAAPGTADAARALEQARCAGPVLVFFHGEGVCVAADDEGASRWREATTGGGRLALCATALERRGLPAPAGFEQTSLATFWNHAVSTASEGGDASRTTPAVLLRVSRPPSGHELAEVLELALAGAALEVDLGVVFEGGGLEHIVGAAGRPWQQFPDFELGPLYAVDGSGCDPAVGARVLNRDTLQTLLVGAERVFDA